MTSSITVPRCESAALSSESSCFLSPENERPTNVAPSSTASAHVSIGGRSLTTPVLSLEPTSAVGEHRAGADRRHAAVDRVEAVRAAEEVRRALARAADARQLDDALRVDAH